MSIDDKAALMRDAFGVSSLRFYHYSSGQTRIELNGQSVFCIDFTSMFIDYALLADGSEWHKCTQNLAHDSRAMADALDAMFKASAKGCRVVRGLSNEMVLLEPCTSLEEFAVRHDLGYS